MRGDLEMDSGKAASQAVHAARLSLLRYIKDQPERADEFISKNSCGTVVVLRAKNLQQMEDVHARALAERLPAALFEDSGHIPVVRLPAETPKQPSNTVQPRPFGTASDETARSPSDTQKCLNKHFDGSPIVTALAIGPAPREALRALTRRFSVWRDAGESRSAPSSSAGISPSANAGEAERVPLRILGATL